MMTDRQNKLYCMFLPVSNIQGTIQRLQELQIEGKIFILDIGKDQEVVITYNSCNILPEEFRNKTVLCHRHKLTKTLYTINALNTLVRQENYGKEDKQYKIDWTRYQDSLLVVQNKELIQFRTKLINII